MSLPRVGILGGGSWATALTKILSTNVDNIHWWMRNEVAIKHLRENNHNPHYIQSVEFDMDRITVTNNMQQVIDASDYIIFAIPSAFLDKTMKNLKPKGLENKVLFSAIKGIINEYDSIPARYLHKEFGTPYDQIGLICGPCHAEEVAKEQLSYLTSACPNDEYAGKMAEMLQTRYIKTFVSDDVFGSETAAVLKNVYAVAAGMCHGLGYGDNFQAVLISNAIREMKVFVEAVHNLHRDVKTSPYLGDLLVTAYSPYSRNRTFGTMVGRGYSVKWATVEMNMVAEGYYAAKGIFEMNKKFQVEIPIAEAIYRILYEKIAPAIEIRILTDKMT
jgi:glycerol-3-phosphate dehydrogenase (NAD(P)+)